MSTYTCSHCNKPLPGKVMRCPHCGVLLSGEVTVDSCIGCGRTIPASELVGGYCSRCRKWKEERKKTTDEESANYLSCAVLILLILGSFAGGFFFWRARIEKLPWQIAVTALTGIVLAGIITLLYEKKILPIFLGGALILASMGCVVLLALSIFGKLDFIENLLPWIPSAIIHAAWWKVLIAWLLSLSLGQALISSARGKKSIFEKF